MFINFSFFDISRNKSTRHVVTVADKVSAGSVVDQSEFSPEKRLTLAESIQSREKEMEFKLPHYQTTTRYQSNNYKRQCKNGVSFAESLLKCGFYQDTTLKSATRAESRDQRVVKRKKSSMVTLLSPFFYFY
jgi:hypothetical protein